MSSFVLFSPDGKTADKIMSLSALTKVERVDINLPRSLVLLALVLQLTAKP